MAETLVAGRPITDIIKKVNVVPTYVVHLGISVKPYPPVRSLHLRYLGIVLCKAGYFTLVVEIYRFRLYTGRGTLYRLLYFREPAKKDILWILICKIKIPYLHNVYKKIFCPTMILYAKYQQWIGVVGLGILMTIRHRWWHLTRQSKVLLSHHVILFYLMITVEHGITTYLPSRQYMITKIAIAGLLGNLAYCLIHLVLKSRRNEPPSLPILSANAEAHIVKGYR